MSCRREGRPRGKLLDARTGLLNYRAHRLEYKSKRTEVLHRLGKRWKLLADKLRFRKIIEESYLSEPVSKSAS
jgi:hypothetical protein